MAEAFDPYYEWLGIPPADQPATHYRLLGLNPGESNPRVIENAADRQMAHLRSLQAGPHSAQSQRLLNEISAARLCLLKPEKKAAYDAALQAKSDSAAPTPKVQPIPQAQSKPQIRPLPAAKPLPAAQSAGPKPGASGIHRAAPSAHGLPEKSLTPQPAATPVIPAKSAMSSASTAPAAPVVVQLSLRTIVLGVVGLVVLLVVVLVGALLFFNSMSNGQKLAERTLEAAKEKENAARSNDTPPTPPIPIKSSQPYSQQRSTVSTNPTTSPTTSSPTTMPSTRQSIPPTTIHISPRNNQPPARAVSLTDVSQTLAAGKSVDLLKMLDIERDNRFGDWRLENGTLLSPNTPSARICLPVAPPANGYRIVADVERLDGSGELALGLVINGKRGFVVFDTARYNVPISYSFLDYADGRSMLSDPYRNPYPCLWIRKPVTIACTVEPSQRMTCECNGTTVFDRTVQSFSTSSSWEKPSDAGQLILGASGKFRVTRLEITPTTMPVTPLTRPAATPVACPPGATIDLLANVDVARDAVMGDWKLENATLIAPGGGWAQMFFPVAVPASYALTFTAERTSGEEPLAILFPGPRGLYSLRLDEHNYLVRLASAQSSSSNIRSRNPQDPLMFPQGNSVSLACEVVNTYVRVLQSDRMLMNASPSSSRTSDTVAVPTTNQPGIYMASAAGFRIQSLKLKWLDPVSSPTSQPFNPPAIAGGVPAPQSNIAGRPSSSSNSSNPTFVDKVSVPENDTLRKTKLEMREKFKSDYARANTPKEKFTLAKDLYARGRVMRDDLVVRYALLDEAREMAAELGEWTAAEQAIERLADSHQISVAEMKAEAFFAANRVVRKDRDAEDVVDVALKLIDAVVLAKRPDLASRLATAAVSAAARSGSKLRQKQASDRAKEVGQLKGRWDSAQRARQTLATTPSDAAAHLALGKYLCFENEEWTEGLLHLMQGSDERLRKLAEAEINKPTETDALTQLADAWWQMSESESDNAKKNLQRRAAKWYKIALPNLSGLRRIKPEERIAEAERNVN